MEKGTKPIVKRKKNVDPQEYSVALFDIVKLVVVANPVHPQYDKAERVGEIIWPMSPYLTSKFRLRKVWDRDC